MVCDLKVRFSPDGVDMTLSVPGEPDAFFCGPEQISRDLIDGYVRQMRGRLSIPVRGGELTVSAPCAPPSTVAADPAAEPATGAQSPQFFRLLDRTHGGVAS